MLVEADPERFFRPPYVGHRGWLGLRLDRELHWDELAGILEDAYVEVAPPKLVEEARTRRQYSRPGLAGRPRRNVVAPEDSPGDADGEQTEAAAKPQL